MPGLDIHSYLKVGHSKADWKFLVSGVINCELPGRVSQMSHLLSSIQFSCSVVSNSLWPHESQHARPPCPSPTPRIHPNPCPLSWWCHPNLIFCHPLLLLPSIFPSIRVFSNELALNIRWPKYWTFSFNISPSNEHPGLVSFMMDCLDLLAVQGTLKSLLQHHNSIVSN